MKRALILGVLSGIAAAAAPAYTAGLQPGQFDVTPAGSTKPTASVCVSDLLALYQIGHGPDRCRYFTVSQSAKEIRVSYECADGSGLLNIKSVTPRSGNLMASGVNGTTPYKRRMVIRRTGDCR